MASRNMTVGEPADARRSSAVQQPAAENQTTITEPAPVDAKTHRPWHAFTTPLIGKAVRKAARLVHSGGSAFPGKIAETIDPGFLARTLGQLPLGVVLVSGTNGKTTTTRMVASVLENLGLKVFTNPTGSNFTRGVVSALLDRVTLGGRLDADIAVLELDEAYAVHFVRQVKPRYCLLLNVMRDQLDRFGEIDNTARLLSSVAEATTGTVVLNREDPRIAALADVVPATASVRYFGLDASLRSFFPSDDDMATTVSLPGLGTAAEHMESGQASAAASDGSGVVAGKGGRSCPDGDSDAGGHTLEALPADVALMTVGDHQAMFRIDGTDLTTPVRLEGVYNLYNAAAALAVVRAVLADIRRDAIGTTRAKSTGSPDSDASAARMTSVAQSDTDALMAALSTVTPAFGRGESIDVNGSMVELLLVKNPMGFRLSLASFPPEGHDTMICINDEYADGRDMSWLWDVDFTSLRGTGVAMISGVRAWDMALRLEYDQVPVAEVDTDLDKAVERFVTANPGTPKHIYCTYTAMLAVRARLGRMTEVADAGVGR